MSTSYSWEGKGRYGSFRLRTERVGVQVKLRDPLRTRAIPERSSELMIHEEALYQVYVPLPLPAALYYTARAR